METTAPIFEPTGGGAMPPPTLASETPTRAVCIVGSVPATRAMAPFDDKNVEIWGVGHPGGLPRMEVFWDLHDFDTYGPELKDYLTWAANFTSRFVVGHPHCMSRVKHPVLYPVHDMIAEHGTFFFSSTVAWMMALAIAQKSSAIHVYGIDMATSEEYMRQKAGIKHFEQVAKKAGIPVFYPPGSDLNYEPEPYPFILETPQELMYRKVAKELRANVDALQAEKKRHTEHLIDLDKRIAENRGGLLVTNRLQNNWTRDVWGTSAGPAIHKETVSLAETLEKLALPPPNEHEKPESTENA